MAQAFSPREEAAILCWYFKQVGLPRVGTARLCTLFGGPIPEGPAAPEAPAVSVATAEELMRVHLKESGKPSLRTLLWKFHNNEEIQDREDLRVYTPVEEVEVICWYFKRLGLPRLGVPRLRTLLGGREPPRYAALNGDGPAPLGATIEEAERLTDHHLRESGLLWRGDRNPIDLARDVPPRR